jgi:hypothetical protein
MRDVKLEQPFLENPEEPVDWDEPAGPPRKDLTYHAEVRRLLEIRDELLQLQKELADFDEFEKLPDDPLAD